MPFRLNNLQEAIIWSNKALAIDLTFVPTLLTKSYAILNLGKPETYRYFVLDPNC